MGLMDKFKNLFTDEEEFDDEDEIEEPVKIKEVKKEKRDKDKLPTFMREKIKKEEKEEDKHDDEIADFKINREEISKVEDELDSVSEKIVDKKEEVDNKFKFPIEFEESDFTDVSRISRQSRNSKSHDILNNTHVDHDDKLEIKTPHKKETKKEVKVAELYKDKKEERKEDSKRFQATPIISPIYGVLDKNYHKDEIEPRGDNYEINRPSKNIDFDSVRKKAYGSGKTLEEDIDSNLMCENCDYYKSANTCKKDIDKDNLMYEALCEKSVDKDITLDEAAENYYDYGVEYEKHTDIDTYPIDEIEEEEVKIVNHDMEEKAAEIPEPIRGKKKEIPPVKSSINMLSTLKKSMGDEVESNSEENQEKNLELTDDLFNLIDSMYEEGNEK